MSKANLTHATSAHLGRLHGDRLAWLEEADGAAVGLSGVYPHGYRVPRHHHSRAQLLHARTGVVMIDTDYGRWLVPPEHAMWIPGLVDHGVEMIGTVTMQSIYVRPGAVEGLPGELRVVGLTGLMESLIAEAVALPQDRQVSVRQRLIMDLLLTEIPGLPLRPLGLPLPAEPRLAALCRRFVENPSPHATIDEWAMALGMSRRAFTRTFLRETGLSLSTWRRQVSLFAALPRLSDGESVTSVALDLGYESVPAFITMFKRMLGASPRSYFGRRRLATG